MLETDEKQYQYRLDANRNQYRSYTSFTRCLNENENEQLIAYTFT